MTAHIELQHQNGLYNNLNFLQQQQQQFWPFLWFGERICSIEMTSNVIRMSRLRMSISSYITASSSCWSAVSFVIKKGLLVGPLDLWHCCPIVLWPCQWLTRLGPKKTEEWSISEKLTQKTKWQIYSLSPLIGPYSQQSVLNLHLDGGMPDPISAEREPAGTHNMKSQWHG
jgi:hypothetical protein